jgi:hypothetical protein
MSIEAFKEYSKKTASGKELNEKARDAKNLTGRVAFKCASEDELNQENLSMEYQMKHPCNLLFKRK